MRNILLIGAALSLLSFGCGGDDKKDCNDTDRDLMAADVAEDDAKQCYNKCVKSDMSEGDCKKACYGDWIKEEDKCKTCYNKCKKDGGNTANCVLECCDLDSKGRVDAGSTDAGAVDAGSDVTGTDAVSVPEDVTPQG